MKKVLAAILAVTLLAMFALPSVTAVADRGKVLVVYGGDSVQKGDKAIGERLKALGFSTVDYVVDKDTTEASWKDYKIVFIGESVTSANVATKFTKAECYVICGEPGLWDELLIGNYNTTYDSNSYKGTYTIVNDLVKSGLKTFTGFSADATPGFLKEWGAGVTVIAENADKAPALTFAAKGAEMFDKSKAVGPRSTIFCRGQSAADFTADSWKLFDALINYALPVPVKQAATTADAAAVLTLTAAASVLALTAWKKRK